MQKNSANRSSVGEEDLLQSLEQVVRQFQGQNLAALNNLKDFQIARLALLQHETDRLSQRLGADHPRVQQLQAQLSQNLEIVKGLEAELEASSVQPSDVSADETLVHGRMVDENQRGYAGLVVILVDEKGQNLAEAPQARTDAVGYYALRLDPAAVERISAAGKVFVAVQTPRGEIIHKSEQPVQLEKGARIVAGATLPAGDLGRIFTGRGGGKQPPRDTEPWVVRGRVLDEDGHGVAGLLVRLFDKDHLFDDQLGAVLTGKEGEFEISYHAQDFREGKEPGADLYLTVSDAEGNTLHTSRKAVRFNAGRVEEFEVKLKKKG